jgi:flagellar basal body P-ring protein FlgI
VDPQKRLQIAEKTEKERDLDVRIVSDVADFGNTGPLQVHGVGLVTGLAGTGHSPEGYYRNLMEQYLLKTMGRRDGAIRNEPKDESARRILDNPNNCLVIVSAFIPAGARKGDRFDADVWLPAGSRAQSLAGGYLQLSMLRVYQAASAISSKEMYKDSNQMLPGHVFADAKGQLVVGFGNNADSNELKQGKVWQGGASRIARPYHLVMRNDEKSIKIANSVAERINFMYQDDPRSKALHADFNRQEKQILLMGAVANQINQKQDPTGVNENQVAKAMNEAVINVRVPFAYRFNHERFRLVSGLTPLRDTDPGLTRYRQRAQKMLLDPHDTLGAAMRLEALGRDSISLLKTGLESDHPYVRFASAEALAYLGSTAGVDALTQLAQQHAVFAPHCTIALANLGESICRHKLGELLGSGEPALRCAAFHALSLLDENDSRLGGLFLDETVWLHRIPRAPGPMVYFSTSKRAQIILFGRNIVLAPGTRMMIRDFTVVHNKEDGQFHVKRITTQGGEKRICTNRVDEVLTALVELKATYPDLVEFLRKANDYRYVNCPIMTWTIADVPLATLIEAGRQMKARS